MLDKYGYFVRNIREVYEFKCVKSNMAVSKANKTSNF